MTEFLEFLDRLGRGYAEFNDRVAAWNDRMQPALKNFLDVAQEVGDGLSGWLIISTMTFSKGGWSEVPLGGMALSEAVPLVESLWDKPEEEIKRELDTIIPEYFRRNDHAALSELVERGMR